MLANFAGPTAIFLGACLLLLAAAPVRRSAAHTFPRRVALSVGLLLAALGCTLYAFFESRAVTILAATAVIFVAAAILFVVPRKNSTVL